VTLFRGKEDRLPGLRLRRRGKAREEEERPAEAAVPDLREGLRRRDGDRAVVDEGASAQMARLHPPRGRANGAQGRILAPRGRRPGEIVAYGLSRRPNFAQTMEMLRKAFAACPDVRGLVFHSDQGWQYQQTTYQEILRSKGIIQSMSRKGDCYDNSPMENFFSLMKKEMLYGHEREAKACQDLKEGGRFLYPVVQPRPDKEKAELDEPGRIQGGVLPARRVMILKTLQ